MITDHRKGKKEVSTSQMGDAIISKLK